MGRRNKFAITIGYEVFHIHASINTNPKTSLSYFSFFESSHERSHHSRENVIVVLYLYEGDRVRRR